jgi:hypothetical protein
VKQGDECVESVENDERLSAHNKVLDSAAGETPGILLNSQFNVGVIHEWPIASQQVEPQEG